MRGLEWAAAFILIFGLIGVEAAYFLEPGSRLQRDAALYWLGCSATVILSSWIYSFSTLLDRTFWRLPDRAWYLTAFLLPPVLILIDGGGTYFTHVDAEGLEQLAAGINLVRHDPSLGVYKMAYFTYPARQYVLNCLPSYFFGASLWTLRLGNSLFFIGSYLFFLSGLVAYLRHRQVSAALFLAGYCGIMIAFAEYTLLNARKFEQTTMPIGATLFFLGAMLLFLVERTPLRFLWMTWVFGFFTECYTPALGSWVLALGILLYLIVRSRHRIFTVSIAYGIVSLWVAYLVVKSGDKASLAGKFSMGTDHLTLGDRILRYAQGLRALAGFDHALLPAPLAIAAVAGLYLSWRYREFRLPVICLWALAVAFASLTFVGSNLDSPGRDLHRALIILPPLGLGLVLVLARHFGEAEGANSTLRIIKFALSLSMAYMVYAGACTVFLVRTFYGPETMDDYDEVCDEFNRLVLSPETVRPMRIYFVPPLDVDLAHSIWFFDPDGVVYPNAPPPGERIPGTYIFSYRIKDTKDRFDNAVAPSHSHRPFIKVERE